MKWIALLLLIANFLYFGLNLFVKSFGSNADGALDGAVNRVDYEVPTIILLSEHESADRFREKENKAISSEIQPAELEVVNPDKQEVKSVLVCREVGPFELEVAANQLVDQLEAQVQSVSVRKEQIGKRKSYWLLIDSSQEEELDELNKKIQSLGLQLDERMIKESKKRSIGPFSKLEIAEGYFFRLLAANINASIEPVLEIDYSYWLVLEWMQELGFKSPTQTIESLLDQFGITEESFLDGKMQQIECL